jgi:excisionase family DNA binding protein
VIITTIADAPKYFDGEGVTKYAIRQAVLAGEIPHKRVGTKYLINIDHVKLWLGLEAREEDENAQGVHQN